MSEEPNGGSAFPIICPEHSDNYSNGMNMRDYFAAQAMTGLLAGFCARGASMSWRDIVADAHKLADLMLAEREK